MKAIIHLYNVIYYFFYNKLGSDKFTSSSASLNILTLFIVVVLLVLINVFFIFLIEIDMIKKMSDWLILLVVVILFLLIRYSIIRIINKSK